MNSWLNFSYSEVQQCKLKYELGMCFLKRKFQLFSNFFILVNLGDPVD